MSSRLPRGIIFVVKRSHCSTSARRRENLAQSRSFAAMLRELIQVVRKNVSIDWMVKRILRRYGYPPDLQEAATRMVLEQAELLVADWA